jgi:hypothetical protein
MSLCETLIQNVDEKVYNVRDRHRYDTLQIDLMEIKDVQFLDQLSVMFSRSICVP